KMRAQQMSVTQEVIDRLAIAYGVSPAPTLAADDARVVPLTLAPTDLATVVRVSEARAAQGLPPFGDFRDDMTISQFKEWLQAQREASTAHAEADAEADAESEGGS